MSVSFAFKRKTCEVCGKDVAIISDGRPVRSHRRSLFHQKALAAKKRAIVNAMVDVEER